MENSKKEKNVKNHGLICELLILFVNLFNLQSTIESLQSTIPIIWKLRDLIQNTSNLHVQTEYIEK